jgi:hypothetical protein
MTTSLHWTREDAPSWDADKQRLFGPAELAATALTPPAPGAPVASSSSTTWRRRPPPAA